MAKCLIKRCGKVAILRGCCHKHYFSVYRAIKAGAIRSWLAASRQGLAVAKKERPGPKRS